MQYTKLPNYVYYLKYNSSPPLNLKHNAGYNLQNIEVLSELVKIPDDQVFQRSTAALMTQTILLCLHHLVVQILVKQVIDKEVVDQSLDSPLEFCRQFDIVFVLTDAP